MKNKTKKNLKNRRRQRGGNDCDNIDDEEKREECNEKYYKDFVKKNSPQVVGFIDDKLKKIRNQNTNTKAGKRSTKTAKKMRS